METILEQIINVLFLFLGNKLKGYRTKIASVITAVLAGWGMLEKSFPDICNNFGILCHVTDSKFYYFAIMISGIVTYILKKLDQLQSING